MLILGPDILDLQIDPGLNMLVPGPIISDLQLDPGLDMLVPGPNISDLQNDPGLSTEDLARYTDPRTQHIESLRLTQVHVLRTWANID